MAYVVSNFLSRNSEDVFSSLALAHSVSISLESRLSIRGPE